MRVILASQSTTRAALLRAAGVACETVSPGVDEDAAKASLAADGATPRDVADALAELKAVKISSRTDGLVIGADQTLDLHGRLVNKPETMQQARGALLALRGLPHQLYSAVVVARAGRPIWRELVTATLRVRTFSTVFLDAYLEAEGEAVLSSVGGYRLEGLGVQLFDRIEGDYFAILGLPMTGLLDCLRRHGALTE